MFQSTVTIEHPHVIINNALAKMESKFRPSDTTVELELDTALEAIRFSRADKYYNQVIKARSQYAVTKLESDLIKLMTRKVNSATYSKEILDHLGSGNPADFERICSEISDVQRWSRIRIQAQRKFRKINRSGESRWCKDWELQGRMQLL